MNMYIHLHYMIASLTENTRDRISPVVLAVITDSDE